MSKLSVLSTAVLILKARGTKHWIDCGTCLGAVRQGNFISWDKDIDIGIIDSQAGLQSEKEVIKADFIVAGFELKAEYWHKGRLIELSFGLDSEKIGLSFYWEENGKAYHGVFGPDDNGECKKFFLHEFTASLFWDLDKINFKGLDCYVPSPVEQYLRERYGEWRIPDNKYIYWRDCKAIISDRRADGN